MQEDLRNVQDKYKFWSQEDIRLDVQRKTFPYSVMMQNIDHDFNFAGVIRCANALGARTVYHLCDKKHYDRRGTVGTHKYTEVISLKTIEEFISIRSQFSRVIAVDCNREEFSGPINSLYDIREFPDNCLLIFGSECSGITKEVLDICDEMIYIPMYGSVRSFNCATASGIVMNSVAQYFEQK
jgi:tRNA G18 (ribose-2'-O)-methylase SpoU